MNVDLNSVSFFNIQTYGKEVADLEEQMAAAKLDLKMVNFIKHLIVL